MIGPRPRSRIARATQHRSIIGDQDVHDTDETDLTAQTLKKYLDLSQEADGYLFDRLNSDLDNLLVFAALFSSTVASFLSQSTAALQEDPQSTTNNFLQRLVALQSLDNADDPGPTTPSFQPSPSAVRVNACWYLSLIISISAAFIAILAKQWILELKNTLEPEGATRRARMRQLTHDGSLTWKIYPIIISLPILLHLSLILFLFALIEFLRPINTIVALAAAIPAYLTMVLYIITHLFSLLVVDCPYETSMTAAIRLLFGSLAIWLQKATTHAPLMKWSVMWDKRPLTADLSRHQMAGFVWGRVSALPQLASYWLKASLPSDTYWLISGRRIDYILSHPDRMDARALSWLLQRSSRLDNLDEHLGQQISTFKALVSHRQLFLQSSVAFLVQQLRKIFPLGTRFDDLKSRDEQASVLKYISAITRLNTEVAEHDPATSFPLTRNRGIPYHVDTAWRESPLVPIRMSGFWPPEETGWRDTEDILFYANALRMQVFNPQPQCSWYTICEYSRAFHRRLKKLGAIANLTDDELTMLVNTTIYIGMFGDSTSGAGDIRLRMEKLKFWRDNLFPTLDPSDVRFRDHTTPLLDSLSVIMIYRPNMGLNVRRQVCWGLWALSGENYFVNSLVPTVTNVSPLSSALAEYLRTMAYQSSLAHAVLAMLEGVLYGHRPDIVSDLALPTKLQITGFDEACDFAELVRALVANYVPFLKAFRQYLEDGKDIKPFCLLPLLRRVVKISDYLAFDSAQMCMRSLDKFQTIIYPTLDVLRCISDKAHTLFNSVDNPQRQKLTRSACRIVYGAVCRIAILSMQEPHTLRTPEFEDYYVFAAISADSLATDAIIPVLNQAPSVDLKSLATLLSLIARLPIIQSHLKEFAASGSNPGPGIVAQDDPHNVELPHADEDLHGILLQHLRESPQTETLALARARVDAEGMMISRSVESVSTAIQETSSMV